MTRTPEQDLLPELFKTRERVAILTAVLESPACTVQEIAGATGITKGLVSRYLSMLAEKEILTREGRGYRLRSGALVRQVKILINTGRAGAILKLPAWAKGIGMYGSWAGGTNTKESDLDIWITADLLPPPEVVASLEREWKQKLQVDLHLLILTPEKIRVLREQDKPFLSSFDREAITLEGSEYERN